MAARKLKKPVQKKTPKKPAASGSKAQKVKEKTAGEKRGMKPKKTRKTTQPQAVKSARKKQKTTSANPEKKKQPRKTKVKTVKPVRGEKPSEKLSIEEQLRKQLLKKRSDILKEARDEITKYIKGETKQLVETALDDGDWSVIDLSEDINLRRLEAHRQSLVKIDETLMKIKEGTYGVCEGCGERISAGRLRVMPFAIYCRDCQEDREELEKAEREII